MKKFDFRPSHADHTESRKNALTARPKNLLQSFEYIVELAENSALSDEFFEKASTHIRYAVRKLKLTPIQVVLLAMFVDRSEDSHIRMSELASYTGCRTTRFLQYGTDIDFLEKLRYIRASHGSELTTYRVPSQVLNQLKQGLPYVHTVDPLSNTEDFFDHFNQLMNERDNNELTYEALKEETKNALAQIKDSNFVRRLKSHDLDEDNMILFIFMAHLYVENNDDNIGFHDIENIYDNDKIPFWVKHSLKYRSSQLFREKLIENVNQDGMASGDAFKLTEGTKVDMLSELSLSTIGRSDNGLIKFDTLAAKKLIYNPTEAVQINQLSAILAKDRFDDVQSRLQKAGMRKGFCCLFYGAPGTGKTETVYQIARATGRNLMRVDVDKIKSCWVGESEKNIKLLFDRYRSICQNSELAPILLFNEADAVLGVRMEGAARAVDKMENSIQNIILQEMETLDGIMIATTNLTSNLDKAFERRFLYKIRYDRPSVESRGQIWKIMMPDLSDVQAGTLGKLFDLSGGEIENIVRKHSVNAILSGSDLIDMDQLIETCQKERISNNDKARIGFAS